MVHYYLPSLWFIIIYVKALPVASALKKAQTGKFTAIRLKYSNKKMHKIATNDSLIGKMDQIK